MSDTNRNVTCMHELERPAAEPRHTGAALLLHGWRRDRPMLYTQHTKYQRNRTHETLYMASLKVHIFRNSQPTVSAPWCTISRNSDFMHYDNLWHSKLPIHRWMCTHDHPLAVAKVRHFEPPGLPQFSLLLVISRRGVKLDNDCMSTSSTWVSLRVAAVPVWYDTSIMKRRITSL